MKTWIDAWMNPSVLAGQVVGTMMANHMGGGKATLLGRVFEKGVTGCAGLRRLFGCQADQQ